MERMSLKNQFESMRKKIQLGSLDTVALHFDNCFFKGRGKRLWSEHTIIQLHHIKSKQLKDQDGFYQNGTLSRERKSSKELAAEEGLDLEKLDEEGEEPQIDQLYNLATRVVGTRKKDYEKLSSRILTSIETAISLDLPTLEETLQLQKGIRHEWRARIPLNLGNNLGNSHCQSADATDESLKSDQDSSVTEFSFNSAVDDLYDERWDDTSQAEKDKKVKTFYEINNITLDNALHENPGAKKGVMMIADYLETIAAYSDDYDVDSSGGEKPV